MDEERFRQGFNLAAMDAESVYPMIWDEPLEDLLAEYGDYLEQVKDLVHRAALAGKALIITIH